MRHIYRVFILCALLLLPVVSYAAQLEWPVEEENQMIRHTFGPRLLRGEYDFHRGIDMPGDIGDPVFAAADGEVFRVYAEGDSDSPYDGNTVVLRHTFDEPYTFHGQQIEKFYTVYLHLNDFVDALSQGDTVAAGERIAEIGQSAATYTHLHFELRLGTTCSLWSSCNTTGFDPHIHPLTFLPYTQNTDSRVRMWLRGRDVETVVREPNGQKDFNRIVVRAKKGKRVQKKRVLDFSNRTSIDASNQEALDTPTAGSITLDPTDLTDSAQQNIHIWFTNLVQKSTNKIVWKAYDAQGNIINRGVIRRPGRVQLNAKRTRLQLRSHKGALLDTAALNHKTSFAQHRAYIIDRGSNQKYEALVVSKRAKKLRLDIFTIRKKKLRRAYRAITDIEDAQLSTIKVYTNMLQLSDAEGNQHTISLK